MTTGANDLGALPRRQVLTDGVYEAIKALVMDRRIEPGTRINIEGLARQLEVSPTPVREALARLESDGLVTKRALVGYSAAALLDRKGLDELYELRSLLEPAAARWAAERITDPELAELSAVVSAMRVTAKEAQTGDAFVARHRFAAQDGEFHERIALASGRALVHQTLARLSAHSQLYRVFFLRGVEKTTISEHAKIVAALRKRDGDAAAAAMTHHLTASRERYVEAVELA